MVATAMMMKESGDPGFNQSALQQSLHFWRSTPSAIESQSPTSEVLLPASRRAVAEPLTISGPWRYVRWGKSHRKSIQPGKEMKGSIGNFYHRVLPGEDLFEVSEKFATYPEVLMEANGILNPANLATGQVLWVPRTHSIQWGNTLWSLSHKYDVPIRTIQNANGIVNPDLIYAGDILIIPEEPDNRNAW